MVMVILLRYVRSIFARMLPHRTCKLHNQISPKMGSGHICRTLERVRHCIDSKPHDILWLHTQRISNVGMLPHANARAAPQT